MEEVDWFSLSAEERERIRLEGIRLRSAASLEMLEALHCPRKVTAATEPLVESVSGQTENIEEDYHETTHSAGHTMGVIENGRVYFEITQQTPPHGEQSPLVVVEEDNRTRISVRQADGTLFHLDNLAESEAAALKALHLAFPKKLTADELSKMSAYPSAPRALRDAINRYEQVKAIILTPGRPKPNRPGQYGLKPLQLSQVA